MTLLGRLVATRVQNIRAYEAERSTVEELRRLSTLRADFVSLVSHELRSPMAAVIGAARTLQERWRELSPEQREAFLALIGDETSRLAELIADVLDTSRIEAGHVQLLLLGRRRRRARARDRRRGRDSGQDEVEIAAAVREPVPPSAATATGCGRCCTNLVENAVKYSPAGDSVAVDRLRATASACSSTSPTAGPGIPRDQQRLIFEKFGRARSAAGAGKPGTGPRPLHRALDRRGARRHARGALGARAAARRSRSRCPVDGSAEPTAQS